MGAGEPRAAAANGVRVRHAFPLQSIHDAAVAARAAYSDLASTDPRVHVGPGKEMTVRDVSVRWPDGTRERLGDVASDRITVLRRGAGRPFEG